MQQTAIRYADPEPARAMGAGGVAYAVGSGLLPDLAPAEGAGDLSSRLEASGIRLSRASVADETTDFRDRPERRDPVARLTVYALNAAVMLFIFPVGFALLIFNILGGENLRTTAHTMALTGLGTALVSAGYAMEIMAAL